ERIHAAHWRSCRARRQAHDCLARKEPEKEAAKSRRGYVDVCGRLALARSCQGDRENAHSPNKEFAFAYFRLLGKWMGEGKLTAHPVEIVPGGLKGVGDALKRLREGNSV